jgi:cellulose synthase/poly-beta-1,6-N-acetylglucosamine synthase-like glycosyltransferase
MEVLFWTSLMLIVYVYIGYPVILLLCSWIFKKPVKKDEFYPTVTLLIPAYNEEKVIEDKIKNSLEIEYPKDKLSIVVISDGSDDMTDEIVKKYTDKGVILKRFGDRMGKVGVLNRAMQEVTSDIVIFSDANTMYKKDAVKKLIYNLADTSVGAVTGDVRLASEKVSFGHGERLYYRYERFIQQKESNIGSIVGVDGAMYAIRKNLYLPPSNNIILDDFVISMNVGIQGYRVIYEPEAIAYEETSPTWRDEFKRRPRITAGAYQALWQKEGVPTWKNKLLLFEYISHRLLRWILPFFLILLFVSNCFLLDNLGFRICFIVQCIFYILAIIGWITDTRIKLFSIPFYFCLVNLGALLGFFRWLFNTQQVTWEKGR